MMPELGGEFGAQVVDRSPAGFERSDEICES